MIEYDIIILKYVDMISYDSVILNHTQTIPKGRF
jgi:hypothetical protein